MNKDHFSSNAISHKELSYLLTKARKENLSIETYENHDIDPNKEFNEIIQEWTKISKKILLMLNKRDQISSKNRDSKTLIAFGAMSAHINMALQALKATELDQ